MLRTANAIALVETRTKVAAPGRTTDVTGCAAPGTVLASGTFVMAPGAFDCITARLAVEARLGSREEDDS